MIDGSPGAAAEQYASRPILVVDDARHHVGAHDQRVLVGSARNHVHPRRQRIEEARTSGAQIESPRVVRTDLVLQQAGGARKDRVRCRGPHDDEPDISRGEAGLSNRPFCGLFRQVGRGRARVYDVSFADAGALQNPFVAGIDELFEIGVRERARRHVRREAGNLHGPRHRQAGRGSS
jgi:hypothetical protein